MTVREITDVIEQFAPLDSQEKWDNCGLCTGSLSSHVSGVLIGFDCTEALVDEAISCGANLIITHHPLIFNPLKRISPEDSLGRTLIKALSFGISIYAAHTTADKAVGGVSYAMASRLGLEDVEILDPETPGCGLGVVGNLPGQFSYEQIISYVKERFGLKLIRCSRDPQVPISRVAMCGGAGSSLLGKAIQAQAQLFITGDVSYHNFFAPDGFMVMDIGHYESEKDIVDILFSLLKKNFPTFAVRLSDNADANPVRYF